MAYTIEYTAEAVQDLKWLKKTEQVSVLSAIEEQLKFEPTVETRNRKRLRPNGTAQWELRVGTFRVLYDVDDVVKVVEIQRVGAKSGNQFVFRGREEEL